MPTIFVSHGAPTLAIEPGQTGPMLHSLMPQSPTPRAILVISAHFESRGGHVLTAHPSPSTIYDFGGFDPALYKIQYSAKGSPELAHDISAHLAHSGFQSTIDAQRGFDHGAWAPLTYLRPQADIPVVQCSLNSNASPEEHFRLGQTLQTLRDDGVLIIGSGGLTHNLGRVFARHPSDGADPTVEAFVSFLFDALTRRAFTSLFQYRQHPLGLEHHPTAEHLMPLFVVAGASRESDQWRRHSGGVTYGLLSMDALSAT